MANFFTIWCHRCDNELNMPANSVDFDETVYVTCSKCKAENTLEVSSNDLWEEIDNVALFIKANDYPGKKQSASPKGA